MHMTRFIHRMTDLDALHPGMLDALLNQAPLLRVRFEHSPDQASARTRREVVDRGRAGRLCRIGARGGVGGVELIGSLRDAPGELLEVQAVIDDADRPDVD